MISANGRGDFSKTNRWLNRLHRARLLSDLNRYGDMGVAALRAATPVDTSATANAWAYRIVEDRKGPRIEWYNANPDESGQTSIAALLEYGHGTKNGGYVPGFRFINPALRPVFDRIARDIERKVKS